MENYLSEHASGGIAANLSSRNTTDRSARIVEAHRLRGLGMSYMAIGNELGVSNATIQRWLKPEHYKTLDKRRRSTEEYRTKQRAYYERWSVKHHEKRRLYQARRYAAIQGIDL